MAELVLTAVVKSSVQDVVSRGSQLIAYNYKEKVSREDNMMKLQIVLNQLKSQLKRTRDFPITCPDLRRELKDFKDAYNFWCDRLDKHKQQLAPVRAWYRPSLLLAPFNKEYLTSENVQDIEWYVDKAKELVERVSASSINIRNDTHPVSLVRKLLEGETIWYATSQGSETRNCWIRSVRLAERGVEVALLYEYSHHSRPGKCFAITLFLRVRESTDMVRIVKECLLKWKSLLPSQLELVRDSAVHELDQLLSGSQGIVTSSRDPSYDVFEARYSEYTLRFRPDSFCCHEKGRDWPCANSTVVSSELSDMFPEEVILFHFTANAGGAVHYNFGTSSEDLIASRDINEDCRPPLEVTLTFAPHGSFEPDCGAVKLEEMGGKELHKVSSVQQFLDIVGSKATECFDHRPQLIKYTACWARNHGIARIEVKKATILQVLHSFEKVKEQWAHEPEKLIQVLSQVFRMVQAEYPQSSLSTQMQTQVQVMSQVFRMFLAEHHQSSTSTQVQTIVQLLTIASLVLFYLA